MEGSDIQQLLMAKGRLAEEQVRLYCAELVQALECLHYRDTVCGDLGARNVIIGRDGHIKVVGVVRRQPEITVGDGAAASLVYMAPEVILGKGCKETADWWSLVRWGR